MSNIDQMDAVQSDASPGCEQPNESTTGQDKASWLRPLPADRPFGECSQRQVQFKAERSANGKFIVSFADGSTIEVTEKQLRSERRFRHCLRVKLGREFAAQSQSSWEYLLTCRGWPRWVETMAEVVFSTDPSDLKLKIRRLPSR